MDDEVTQWVRQLSRGDEAAAQRIWSRYFAQLVRLARQRLADVPRQLADEEDVALSAFASFCRGLTAGRFPNLRDRHDLWRLLVTITARKAWAQLRLRSRQKRGARARRGECVPAYAGRPHEEFMIGTVLGKEPTPEFALMMSEECESLFRLLNDESLRQVALYKLEGYSNKEIAQRMECASRTVERKLARIRDKWLRKPGEP